jgi:phage terminase large subunit-like protein
MRLEYAQYKLNPANNTAFITKRMNRPPKILENGVTEWENILATNRPIDEAAIKKRPCVAGIDYMKTTDFLGAGLLWRVGDEDIWISHTWVCSRSADLPRIKAPLRQWEAQGLLTFIDAPEIPPDIPAIWLATEAAKRGCMILRAGIDNYRFTLMKNALAGVNLSDENKRVKLIRPSDEMKHIPIITAGFASHRYVWGDSPPMRWCCNNSKTITSAAGNTTYGKIEPKSRKTDTFKAFVAAEIVSDVLDIYAKDLPKMPAGVYTY